MDTWSKEQRNLLNAIPSAVHVVNREGILVDANQLWLMRFGVTMRNVLGRPLREVMRDLAFANPTAIDPNTPESEYNSPAACRTIETGLPASMPFHGGKSYAVARPIYSASARGSFNYVLTTVTDVDAPGHPVPETKPEREGPHGLGLLVGGSPGLQRVQAMIARAAPTMANVLITGESGTGKEIAATQIHRASGRRQDVFVRVNCAAIPESLIESELFGYERGAFTGALTTGKAGLIEAADGGTLFLDEINALPLPQQGKLLRVLESRSVQRVGGLKEKPVDFRLITATNAELEPLVKQGSFRADLYWRINVLALRIPPLRERREDVMPILRYYLDFFGQQYGRQLAVSDAVERLLTDYRWPGNVRQLRNLAEFLVVTVEHDEILPAHVLLQIPDLLDGKDSAPAEPDAPDFGEDFSLREYLANCERDVLERAYRQFGSSRSVAHALKIDQSSVIRKREKYGILPDADAHET